MEIGKIAGGTPAPQEALFPRSSVEFHFTN
jgi:hypothetical protein